MKRNNFQIVYFPYLFLNNFKSIKVLGVTVWNSNLIPNRIRNQKLRNKITALIKQNKILGKPIENIGIVNMEGRDDFHPVSPVESKLINEVRIVLFIAGVAKCNIKEGPITGHTALTSDHFKVVYQNFKLDSPYTGYQRGVIVRLSDFGYRISEMTYEMPPYVPRNHFSCEDTFLNILERLKRKKVKTYRLILRAAEALMNAYTNSEDVSHESRILELSRSFEILFQLPEMQQRRKFKEAIKKYCEPVGERRRRFLSERPGKKRKPENGSRQVMWADRFYTLRNHIIHGEKIAESKFLFYSQPHFKLALWFFLVAVKQIINETLNKKYFYDFIKCESGIFVYDEGFWEKANKRMLKTLLEELNA